MPTLYLASASPRRRELLTQIGVPFRLLACSVDESVWPAESPERYVERLARAKAQAGMVLLDADADACVLGADTSVVLDGRILGKPADRDDALQMLQSLSGREHQVMTAVAVAGRQGCAASLVVSRVAFRDITPEQIQAYWDTGEPQDKAGGYAIQEWIGLIGIKEIKGDYYNVMGLPVAKLLQELKKL